MVTWQPSGGDLKWTNWTKVMARCDGFSGTVARKAHSAPRRALVARPRRHQSRVTRRINQSGMSDCALIGAILVAPVDDDAVLRGCPNFADESPAAPIGAEMGGSPPVVDSPAVKRSPPNRTTEPRNGITHELAAIGAQIVGKVAAVEAAQRRCNRDQREKFCEPSQANLPSLLAAVYNSE